ncbi:MAG: hypothetical protein JNM90_17580 [Burkholderiales bacterium]|nr:hypothetical protein [Burkholderiales bacterium]
MAITTVPPGRRPASVTPLTFRLLEIMREEQLALERNDVDATSGLLRAKERAIAELRAAAGGGLDAADLARLRDAAAVNRTLGQHIDARLAYTRARLAGLDAAVAASAPRPAVPLYERNGRQGSRGLRLGAPLRA